MVMNLMIELESDERYLYKYATLGDIKQFIRTLANLAYAPLAHAHNQGSLSVYQGALAVNLNALGDDWAALAANRRTDWSAVAAYLITLATDEPNADWAALADYLAALAADGKAALAVDRAILVSYKAALVKVLSRESPQKNTYLHIAAALDSEALAVRILRIHQHLLFKQNKDGDSPLHIAAKEGKLKIVEALLDWENKFRGHGLENGYELLQNVQNNQRNTALNEALINGHTPVAQFLISNFPTTSNFFESVNNENKSPLYLAVETGCLNLVGKIDVKLAKKIDQTTVEQAGENEVIAVEEENDIVAVEEENDIVAAEEENDVIVAEEENGLTAVEGENSLTAVEVGNVRVLKKSGRVCKGKSPMQAAVFKRSRGMLEMLSEMKLDIISPKDEKGRTPLHNAASTGYLEGVCFLLRQSTCETYEPDESGVYPIHTAASKGYIDIIDEFLKHFLDAMELQNTHGQNILHVGATCGRENVVKYVLKHPMLRKLINQKDNNGDTPLHLAARYNHPLVVSTLTCDKRTSLKLVNNEGYTALDVAEGNMDIFASFHGRLTWITLKSEGAQRAEHLHVLLRKKAAQMPSPGSQFPNLDQMHGLQLRPLERLKDGVNTLLLVATLVATVTFAAGFTMPGGLINSDTSQGMATMLREVPFQIFVICDTLAMHCSIIIAVTLIWAQLGDLNLVLSALRFALPMLGLAVTMMSVAFTAGLYVVVSNLHWLAGVVLGMGALFVMIGLFLFVPLFFPSTSARPILRYLLYYPFRWVVWASGNFNQ